MVARDGPAVLPYPAVHLKGHGQEVHPARTASADVQQRGPHGGDILNAPGPPGPTQRTAKDVRGDPCTHSASTGLQIGSARALVPGLHRATVAGLVVDEDGGARLELMLDLRDFGREGDVVQTIVGPLAR